MSIFTGNVYELTLVYTYNDTTAFNVWHYGVVGGSGSADNLCSSFAEDILPTIQSITSEDVDFTQINARGVQGVFDFDLNGITAAGEIESPPEPNFVAFAFRFNRSAGLERNGYKRIGGVPDNAWEDGAIPGGVLTALAAAAPIIGGNCSSAGNTYQPLVQRRQFEKVVLETPEYYTFSNCSFVNMSTQSSRKR